MFHYYSVNWNQFNKSHNGVHSAESATEDISFPGLVPPRIYDCSAGWETLSGVHGESKTASCAPHPHCWPDSAAVYCNRAWRGGFCFRLCPDYNGDYNEFDIAGTAHLSQIEENNHQPSRLVRPVDSATCECNAKTRRCFQWATRMGCSTAVFDTCNSTIPCADFDYLQQYLAFCLHPRPIFELFDVR